MITNCAANIIKILLFFSILSFDVAAQVPRSTSFDKRPACEAEKGSWRRFGNGCADSCRSKFDKFSMCTQAIVYACDCGDNKCWNGKYCVELADYERVYMSVEKKRKERLDKQKELRRPLAQANRNRILKKMIHGEDPNGSQEGAGDQKSKTEEANVVDPKDITPLGVKNGNNPTTEIQIPPFFLKKQAEQEAARKALEEAQSGSNVPVMSVP